MERKTLIFGFVVSLLSLTTPIAAQELDWVNQLGGSSATTTAQKIIIDKENNSYSFGTYSGVIDLDPGAGTYTINSEGKTASWLLKLSPSGAFLWGYSMPIAVTDIASDKTGNVLVLSAFGGIVDAAPGPTTYTLQVSGSGACILKLNSLGNFVWAKALKFESYGLCQPKRILTDSLDHVYTFGVMGGPGDFDPGPGTYTVGTIFIGMQSVGAVPANTGFFSCLDSSGSFVFAKRLGGDYEYSFIDVCKLPNGEFIEVESTKGRDNPNSNLSSLKYVRIFKYGTDGVMKWSRNYNNSASAAQYFAAGWICPMPNNNILVGGICNGSTDLDPGPQVYQLDAVNQPTLATNFLLQLNTTGAFVRATTPIPQGSTGSLRMYAAARDTAGNIYIGGAYKGWIDFDSPTSANAYLAQDYTAYLLKLDSIGNYNWVKHLGSGATTTINSLAIDQSGSLYSAGIFPSTVDFDPGPNVYPLNCQGVSDAFIHKMGSEDLITGIVKQQMEVGFFCFPNPAKAILNVKLEQEFTQAHYKVIDLNGRVLHQQSFSGTDVTIDVSHLSPGVYILEMSGDEVLTRKKFVKE